MNAEQILKCSNLKALEDNQGGKEWGDKYSGKKENIVRQADTLLLFTLRHFTTDKLCKVKRQGDKHNETHKKLKTPANFCWYHGTGKTQIGAWIPTKDERQWSTFYSLSWDPWITNYMLRLKANWK